MTDRFKFRVWNKKTKTMHDVEGVYPYQDEYTQGGEVFLKGFKTSYYFPEQVVLMQCTGLKDKNGKLIYEGDIVKFGEFYEEWHSFHIGKVYWGGEYSYPAFEIQCSTYDFDTCNGLSYIFGEGLSIEVIGNIYENIDLLEVKND